MTAVNPRLAAAIAATGVPLSADLVAPQGRKVLTQTKSRLREQRLARRGRSGELGPVIKALHAALDLLESERWERRRLGVHTTDYVLLMRACYGPLLQRNPRTERWELVSRRRRPDGALEAARAVTADVVQALGGESGATVQDIRAAINRLGGAA
ncbi:hypothetical protein [Streptomyces sp. NPDC060027]|uniref:hypothetical protein n=1 Tax=Streptomyces sp. NPDC060027 TaxID=3347040 RepID=UPI0036C99CA2